MKALLASLAGVFLVINYSWAQNIVSPDEIVNPLHRQHSGKIVFLSSALTLEETRQSHLLDSFVLKEGNDLSIRLFMHNSLTNYLHQLDGSASAEQLLRQGNFQFRFYVNEKLIYTENLSTGAGTAQGKNQWTTLRIPLISAAGEDSWGRYLWMRFYYANDGADALVEGKQTLKIEVRPYLRSGSDIRTGEIIASGEIDVITPAVLLTQEEIALQPVKAASGWPISKEKINQALIQKLNQKIASKRFNNITSIIVIKDGRLLLEEYFNNAIRNTLHNTRSVGKSFASTMMGMAISDGHIKDENQQLGRFYNLKEFANYTPAKDSVPLKSLLTMSSGFDGSDQDASSPGNEENMYPTDNWVKFALDLPMNSNKRNGAQWDYFTAGVVLLGDILDKNVPGGLEKYAAARLFEPLGIKDYKWQYTPQKVPNTAGGLALRSLDLAKYGQLYKNNGQWNGKQILPKEWIGKSFTSYFPEDKNLKGYGYLFWKETFDLNGKTYEAFGCSGNGGNKVYVFKELSLVIVITATAYNKPYAHPQVKKIMNEYLLPAITVKD
ncbi:beta-lactamase family protein [Terrimonas sp. NA20]|uniref:Beta-lactamase family protein n=1 Tax=Terrimonas ginsenosidimutans TaxID=2908004 RepID=A0ABS9KQF6_9BACT|nr:serine hydrolase [Terrimonas ginsenosidimutans]MCG2614559.1 beta-lactamase family protein [Terrimonas ginsenosidimutans]